MKHESDKQKAAEMWFYRRLLRVIWTDKRTIERILEELSIKSHLLHEIDIKWLRYFGHANRRTAISLMAKVVIGKVEGKRRRGRPQMSYICNAVAPPNRSK